ncbi:YdcF family protein [Lactococcus garvieae]|uniref:YdcF family protein n=1 Tax=Lactococcus garvieae TaxID=1363 RepID=UPI0018D73D8F|nr:YdcF family protein [Lactococcus garvieae]QPS71098.1 YdcF family protein [Lactococcus garvieae]
MKKFFRVLSFIIGLGLIYALICLGLIFSASGNRSVNTQDIETILVLGSKINSNGQPAQTTKDRLDTALELAQHNPRAQVIVSGYRSAGSPVSEAEGMARYLKSHGLNSDRIIQEKKARNTVENFAFSKKYIRGATVIVTSDFHLYRSLYLASKLGYEDYEGFAAFTHDTPPQTLGHYARETLALGYYLIKFTLFSAR